MMTIMALVRERVGPCLHHEVHEGVRDEASNASDEVMNEACCEA
jgi:hypothetical protein